MTCPLRGERQRLVWDSEVNATRSNPYRDEIRGFPRIIPIGAPLTTRPLCHAVLAYNDLDGSYYIYVKCIWHQDVTMICNTLISTRAAKHIQIYWVSRSTPLRVGYVDDAYVILFDGLAPAFTKDEALENMFGYFRQFAEARGYTFRRYYDDVDADLPATSRTPWRPKIPKGARGWEAILNLPDRSYTPGK